MSAGGTRMRKALVVGASGIVGRNLCRHLHGRDGWQVVGASRRAPGDGIAHAPLDLLDAASCRAALAGHRDVTHLFFMHRIAASDPVQEEEVHRRAVANVLDALEPAAALERVCIVEGTKWYGCHLGPYRLPAKENHPRHMPPNIYYGQHDEVVARQEGRAWTWSALRPHTIWGLTEGTGSSIAMTLAVYAVISRELGLPLRFPGPVATYDSISQATHMDILQAALVWAATDERCANQSFNITNGDCYRWRQLWPRVAAFFGMPVAEPQPLSLAVFMKDKAPLWDAVVRREGLRPLSIDQLADWRYGDGLLACGWDDLSSVVKARTHGFTQAMDSEDAFLATLGGLVEAGLIPA